MRKMRLFAAGALGPRWGGLQHSPRLPTWIWGKKMSTKEKGKREMDPKREGLVRKGSKSSGYLADLIDSYEPSRCLRSTHGHLLAVPSCVKSSFASRAFGVSSPNNWNSLPAHIRSSDSLVTFQSRLKSHLFSSAYHV